VAVVWVALGLVGACSPGTPRDPPALPGDLRGETGSFAVTGWVGEPIPGQPGDGWEEIPDDRARFPARAAPAAAARILPGVREPGLADVIFRDRGPPSADRGAWEGERRAAQDRWLAEVGRTAHGRSTLIDRVRVSLSPGDLARFAADPRVERIEPVAWFGPDANGGAALRHATGVAEVLAAGLDGSLGPGRNPAVDEVYVAIVDVGDIDADHPAWRDRRALVSVWDDATQSYVRLADDAELAADPANHGSAVATQLLSSDADVDRAGLAPGVAWMFVRNERGDLGLDEAVLESADVINLSQSCTSCEPCTQDSWAVDAVDRAMLSGALVVSTPGNVGHLGGCSVRPPGTASGSLTVNATLVRAGDLGTADLTEHSARGGDRWGRSLVDLVAPGGRDGENQADWDDTWHDMGVGTSYAAPLVAAAGADLLHWMTALWGPAATDRVGLVYAELLLTGDRALGPDPDWGFGRMVARPLLPGHVAAPWQHRWWALLLDDGETRELPLYDGGSLPTAAGRLEIAGWWHEPNLADGEQPAEVALAACSAAGCFDAVVEPGTAHLEILAPGGQEWTIVLAGQRVPPSTDAWLLPGEPRRAIHLVATWEP
jgi:hypothetical protein